MPFTPSWLFRRSTRSRRLTAVGLAALLAASVVTVAGPSDPVAAAGGANLSCVGGTIYSLDATDHVLYSVDTATAAQTPVTTFGAVGSPVPNQTSLNGLAITQNGTAAYAVMQAPGVGTPPTIYRFDPRTGQTQAFAGPALSASADRAPTIVMGGIDPANDVYYFGIVDAAARMIEFYGFDTTTNTAIPGRIGTLAGYSGTNGDLVFDSLGHMYLVSTSGNGSATANPLVAVGGVAPSTGADLAFTGKTIANLTPNNFTFNGIAFDSSGELYVEAKRSSPTQDVLYELNPNSGATIATRTLVHGSTVSTDSYDLASCTYNNSLTLQKKDVRDRLAPSDQFALSIAGAGLTVGNTGTTAGTDTGVQSDPGEVAGPVIGISNATYTLSEAPAGTANAAQYLSGYRCVDLSDNGEVLASGVGTSFDLAFPSAPTAAGRNVVCTFTNGTLSTTKALSTVNGKAVGDGGVRSGDVLAYTVSVSNPMPAGSPSATTTLTETVPSATTYTGTGEGWTCATDRPSVPCTQTVTVPPGATVTKTFTVTVGALAVGVRTVANTVATSSGACIACTVTTPTAAQLDAKKHLATVNGQLAGVDQAVQTGDVLGYAILVTNTGGSIGTTTLTETVPTGATYTGTGEGWGCTGTAAGATCTRNVTVGPDAQAEADFTVTVASLAANIAAITNTVLTTTGGCSACTVTTPTVATLDTVKGLDTVNGQPALLDQPVRSGDRLGYVVIVTNTGGSADATTITETVPANTTYTGTGEGWTCTGTTARSVCTQSVTVGPIRPATLTFTVTVDSLPSGVAAIDNTVTTSTGTCSNCTVDNPTGPALDTTKSIIAIVGAAPVGPKVKGGDVIRYGITVSNSGGSAGETTLTETVPAATTYTGIGEGWTCAAATAGSSCTQSVDVAASSLRTVTFTVTVATPIPAPTTDVINTVASDSGTCSACTVDTPVQSAHLTITKVASASVVTIGDPVTYTVTVTNHGPDTATDVSVTDSPTGLTLVSATPSVGAFDRATGRWTIGSLSNGARAVLTAVYRVTATAAENTATVREPDQSDPDAPDGGTTVTTPVVGVNPTGPGAPTGSNPSSPPSGGSTPGGPTSPTAGSTSQPTGTTGTTGPTGPTGTADTTGPIGTTALASTGVPVRTDLGWAIGFVLLGLALVGLARRRRT